MKWITIWVVALATLIHCEGKKKHKHSYEPKKDTTIYTIDTLLDFFSKRYPER